MHRHKATPHKPHIRPSRLCAVALLVLAFCLCLTAGQAEAGPPRDSDFKELKLKKAQCKGIVRRDSFRGAPYYDEAACMESGYISFKLPSGKEVYLDTRVDTPADCDQLKRWYDGSKRGKMITVHYVVRREWGEHCQDTCPPDCLLKAELIPPRR